jgi:triphosphoribosyl-dephospho-CoA synthase
MPDSTPLPIGLCAQLACIFDVAFKKPGNISFCWPGDYIDFLASAAAIAPVMEQAPYRAVGVTILESVRATRRVTAGNTNLGIILLLSPLASVPPNADLRGGVMRALMRLTVDDARAAYEAIRLAGPGGIGRVDEQDVAAEPTVNLREAMALAADRDMVARQYVNDFEQVFEGMELVRAEIGSPPMKLVKAVTALALRLLAKYPDSLIARKFGADTALEVMHEAQRVASAHSTGDPFVLKWFDERLRGGGHNPGTTADLVTASLFAALRAGIIEMPLPFPFRFPDR